MWFIIVHNFTQRICSKLQLKLSYILLLPMLYSWFRMPHDTACSTTRCCCHKRDQTTGWSHSCNSCCRASWDWASLPRMGGTCVMESKDEINNYTNTNAFENSSNVNTSHVYNLTITFPFCKYNDILNSYTNCILIILLIVGVDRSGSRIFMGGGGA